MQLFFHTLRLKSQFPTSSPNTFDPFEPLREKKCNSIRNGKKRENWKKQGKKKKFCDVMNNASNAENAYPCAVLYFLPYFHCFQTTFWHTILCAVFSTCVPYTGRLKGHSGLFIDEWMRTEVSCSLITQEQVNEVMIAILASSRIEDAV